MSLNFLLYIQKSVKTNKNSTVYEFFRYSLPDYDHEISVFDYYVDESGEWDSWSARVPEATYTGTTDILGEVKFLKEFLL